MRPAARLCVRMPGGAWAGGSTPGGSTPGGAGAAGGAALRLATRMLAAVGRASVRQELDEEAAYAEGGGAHASPGVSGETADAVEPGDAGVLPLGVPMASAVDAPLDQAMRDAMSLVWRVLLAWLAVLALFVVAGWVN